jgi:hypothetical protein|eukprot:COSAG01_NODE_960_length_12416_cov_3.072501_2_plen_75_part_00
MIISFISCSLCTRTWIENEGNLEARGIMYPRTCATKIHLQIFKIQDFFLVFTTTGRKPSTNIVKKDRASSNHHS